MKKILLTILPYWDPMIPPMGITSLKRYLQNNGYIVKTVDYIVKEECLDYYTNYFEIIKKHVPYEKRGNFLNIGHDVLQNQMMAHLNYDDIDEYIELIKLLIYNHYYVKVDNSCALDIIDLTDKYYKMLEDDFLTLLDEFKPDILGATAYKCTIPSTFFVLKLAKNRYPQIKTIVGGGTFNESHAPDSPSFDAFLEYSESFLDKVIIGQGELLFLKYLKGELPEAQRVYSRQDIDGQILDFHQLENPDFSDLDLSIYPCMAASASASCIYNCSFCTAQKANGPYRKNTPEKVVESMTQLYKLHGHQLFFMTDSLINPVIQDLANEFIKSNISLYYDAYFKVDDASADINNTLLWRKGGLYRVRLGAESGSQRILDAMNKLITPKQIAATIKALAYAGIKTTTYWVIGHPGETEEDFQKTLDLIEECKNDIYQTECNYFLYHYSNQGEEDDWSKDRMPLYPDWSDKMLLFKNWTLNRYPLREEAFDRVHRFEAHCRKLGIPNPYSLKEYHEADQRWQRLHKNAAPALTDFKDTDRYIDECKSITSVSYASSTKTIDDKFEF
ncbi:MAG: radical SAM protein [Bacteroidales bacterium]|nr:radical SAM protein [Bacteroidales bacterium]